MGGESIKCFGYVLELIAYVAYQIYPVVYIDEFGRSLYQYRQGSNQNRETLCSYIFGRLIFPSVSNNSKDSNMVILFPHIE